MGRICKGNKLVKGPNIAPGTKYGPWTKGVHQGRITA
jgi:hypothetical protein